MYGNEALIDNKLTISSKYYGQEDYVTGFEVKQFVDNMPFFETFYSQYPLMIIYLLVRLLASMK